MVKKADLNNTRFADWGGTTSIDEWERADSPGTVAQDDANQHQEQQKEPCGTALQGAPR